MSTIDILSEVSGSVWKVNNTVGDQLDEDDVIFVVESMKMEIPVDTAHAGKLVELLVNEGDQIKEGQLVARIEY